MLAVYRELEGSAQLLAHAIRRIGVLRVLPVAEELTRQIYYLRGGNGESCCAAPSSAR